MKNIYDMIALRPLMLARVRTNVNTYSNDGHLFHLEIIYHWKYVPRDADRAE